VTHVILYPQTIEVAQSLAPRLIELAVEGERLPAVGGVADQEDDKQGGPEEDVVNGKDAARVEQGTGEADEGGKETDDRSDRSIYARNSITGRPQSLTVARTD
jgi:hypothetical protein